MDGMPSRSCSTLALEIRFGDAFSSASAYTPMSSSVVVAAWVANTGIPSFFGTGAVKVPAGVPFA